MMNIHGFSFLIDGGYETVPDLDATNSRIEGISSGALPINEHGYQSVRKNAIIKLN
jgi:hypothetical protein